MRIDVGGTLGERCRTGIMRKRAIANGDGTDEDWNGFADDWDKWVASEDAWHGSMHGEVLIYK